MGVKSAVLGGGCFWCIQSAFSRVHGVVSSVAGYAGGSIENPSYEQVCSGCTGHAEVVRVDYDDKIMSYESFLGMFFSLHDPTMLNRQGADVGTQYRSVIFYVDELQLAAAHTIINALENSHVYAGSLVTEVAELDHFYPAEDYHQGFAERNPANGYCQAMIFPKLQKFMEAYKAKLKC